MYYIVLAGGSGTRLFPVSRESYPKQFVKLFGSSSLFQKTIKRFLPLREDEKVLVSTREAYKFLVIDQLETLGVKDKVEIICEPLGKDTAPAIAFAVRNLLELGADEDSVVFIAPSDHYISPDSAVKELIPLIEKAANEGFILTFGIKPTKPETGYGYIEVGQEVLEGVYKVKQFKEKPTLEKAVEYLEAGSFLWNSGMFAFRIDVFKEELKLHAPEIYSVIFELPLDKVIDSFSSLPSISIDYALMEKTSRAAVIPCSFTWSDVGSWDSVYELSSKGGDGNVLSGTVYVKDVESSLIINRKDELERLIVAVGLKDIIAVESGDVILLVRRGDSQKVKEVVKALKELPEFKRYVLTSPKVFRPWGYFVELGKGEGYKIKKIFVKPGKRLSYQMHYHRSEHWIVVKGTAKVVLDGEEFFVHENESIFIPKTAKHRLENPGKIPLEVIEVQVGNYLEEDDIVRFKDDYGRNS